MKLKKLLSITLVSAMACAALASCTSLIDKGTNNIGNGGLTYIGLRINPEIEMVADENGTIVSANAVNTDGEVVLSTVELEGKTIEDATEAFTETAIDLGYMDPEAGKDTVYVDVNGETTEAAEVVEKKINDKLVKFFEKKGITGKVSKEVLDTYLATAEEWNVTPGHAKIIARVLTANPELTYDELLNLTVKDLLELLKTSDKIAVDCKKDYNDAVKALKEEYKELFELREAIDDIEDKLEDALEEDDDDDDDDDEKLTEEEIAALEAELAEKKAKADELKKEYDEKLAALKAEFKATSEQARDEHRKKAEERKQAKKDGKHFDDDDDDNDDDEKHENKSDRDDHDDDDDERHDENKKPEHDDDDDDDDDDDRDDKKHQNKGDKAPAADAPVVEAPAEEETAA